MTGPEPRRVLLTADAVGGVWQYALELAAGLGGRGIEVTLAVLGPPPDAAQRAAAQAVARLDVTGLPLDWTAVAAADLEHAARELAALAAAAGVDSVHLHSPALIGDADWPAPVVAVMHSCVGTWWRAVRGGPLPADLAWRAARTGAGLARAAAVIAPSHAFAAAVEAAYAPQRPIAVVWNGRRPARLPDLPREPAVLTAGRLWDEGKNIAVLDRAAAAISAPVRAAGPLAGPNGDAIRLAHLQTVGPSDAAGMARLYATHSLYAAPACYEPFGLAVLEAAQSGLALVLADTAGFRELWDGAARFVAADDAAAWSAALAGLLDDPAATARLAAAARARAARFTPERMLAGTLAIHREVSARARPALVE